MQKQTQIALTALVCLGFLGFVSSAGFADRSVAVVKAPDGGIQPQAAVDGAGTMHLIYFKGDAGSGDLFYVTKKRGQSGFSQPMRVNEQAGTAVAAGTVRGGQIALGKNGRVHVAWNGSSKAKGKTGSAMLYAHLNEAGTGFQDERNLMQHTAVLDGGGTVAADAAGNVYVAWHGVAVSGEKDEEHRQVWLSRSRDDGRTFGDESPAWSEPTGACGCCSMRAFADAKGTVHVLYRAAKESVNRDMYLLASNDRGETFEGALVHKWKVSTCPMSTMAFGEGPNGVVGAWETEGQIYFASIERGTAKFSAPRSVPGSASDRHHPAVALNTRGETIVAWAEGTGWKKGGALAWQVFNAEGKPTAEQGRVAGGIPVWGLPTAVAQGDDFVVVH